MKLLLSTLALVACVGASAQTRQEFLDMQREALDMQREALEQQRESVRLQRNALEEQRYEASYDRYLLCLDSDAIKCAKPMRPLTYR